MAVYMTCWMVAISKEEHVRSFLLRIFWSKIKESKTSIYIAHSLKCLWCTVILQAGETVSPADKAERRCLEAVVETGTQHAARYLGAEPYRHRRVITPSLYLTRSGTSSQWSSVCNSCHKPRSNFRVPPITRAAEFNTRCNLLVMI